MKPTPLTVSRKPADTTVQGVMPRNSDDGRGPVPARKSSPLQVVGRHWWCVVAVVAASLGATYAYERKLPPIYTSSARIYVQQSGPIILNAEPQGGGNSDSYLYIQGELFKSSGLLEQALRLSSVRSLRMLVGARDPAAVLRSVLRVEIDYKYNILSILADSGYADDAAKLVDAIVQTYVIYQNEQRKLTSAEVVNVLQHEKTKREAELSQQYQRVAEFRKTNGILSLSEGDKGNIILQRLSLISTALTNAQLDVIRLTGNDETANQVKADSERVIKLAELDHADGGGYDVWRSRINVLDGEATSARRQLANLLGPYGEGHKEVKAMKGQIAALEAEVAFTRKKAAEDYVDLVHRRLMAAKQREVQLQKDFKTQEELAFVLNNKAAECATLESDVRRLEKLSDLIDTRIKEIHVGEDSGPMNVTVLQSADFPTAPSSPQKARAMGIAGGVGLFLGVCCAFALEWCDGRVRSPHEVSTAFRVRILAMIPRKRRGSRGITSVGKAVESDPNSDYAEAFRRLRATLCSSKLQGLSGCLLVTSPSPCDGKSVVISNLGIALAQAGRRTLIVDGDLRRPTQHTIFDVANDDGLAEALIGSRKFQDVVRKTGVANLDLLTAGQSKEAAVRMLGSNQFVQLLERLGEQYDNILIDSPPVLPVADALSLAAVCDSAMLILRAEKSTRREAAEAMEGLRGVGVPIIGVVSNMMSRPVLSYDYQYTARPAVTERLNGADPKRGATRQITAAKNGSSHSGDPGPV